jgi:fructose-bisphosphate aldolase (EC 4.1.2.13)
MRATRIVQKILSNYEGETPGVKGKLCQMLMQGKLGGTGKMIILPVDQGFEHGPARSFAPNPAGYDPHYHYQLAIDAGLSAYAAPLGRWRRGPDTFAGQIPTILKVNSANSLMSDTAGKNQAVTASVDDALRLGCAAIGFTIYPGSDMALDMFEEIVEMRKEAAAKGVATVIVVLSARRGDHKGRRDGDRRGGLCGAYRGAAGCPYHQDQAFDRSPDVG